MCIPHPTHGTTPVPSSDPCIVPKITSIINYSQIDTNIKRAHASIADYINDANVVLKKKKLSCSSLCEVFEKILSYAERIVSIRGMNSLKAPRNWVSEAPVKTVKIQ